MQKHFDDLYTLPGLNALRRGQTLARSMTHDEIPPGTPLGTAFGKIAVFVNKNGNSLTLLVADNRGANFPFADHSRFEPKILFWNTSYSPSEDPSAYFTLEIPILAGRRKLFRDI